MEKRIGTVIIYVGDRQSAPQLNEVLSRHADIIVCRQGFPRQDYSLISVVFEGTTDRIGSLTGQLGRIEGINVKSALLPIEHPCGNPHPSASPAGDASSVTPTAPSLSASPTGDASSVTQTGPSFSASPAGDASSVTQTGPSLSASPAGDASSVTDIFNQLHP